MGREESFLLAEFIKLRKESYVEPVSRGPTPGGFSAKKYIVSLFTALTSYEQRWIAEKSNVGHGLLRKWRTEEPFKSIEEKHRRDFIAFFIQKIEKDRKQTQEVMQLGNLLFHKFLEDFTKYSSVLKKQIINTFQSPKNLGRDRFYKRFAQVLSLQDAIARTKNFKKTKLLNAEMDREFQNLYLIMMERALTSMALTMMAGGFSKKEAFDMGYNLHSISLNLSFYILGKKGRKVEERIWKEYEELDEEGRKKLVEQWQKRDKEIMRETKASLNKE